MKIINKIKFNYRITLIPYQKLLSEILPDGNILDIGCGSGSILTLIAKNKSPKTLGGLEITQELVDECFKNLKRIFPEKKLNIELYNGSSFPKYLNSYSQVLLIDVLHHIPNDKKIEFLKNLKQSLSENTLVIVKDINADNKFLLLFNKLHDLLSSGSFGYEISAIDTIKLLKDSGFKLLRNYSAPKLVYAHHFYICTT